MAKLKSVTFDGKDSYNDMTWHKEGHALLSCRKPTDSAHNTYIMLEALCWQLAIGNWQLARLSSAWQ